MRAVQRVSVAGSIVMLTLVASAFTGAPEAPAEEHTPAPYLALGDSLPYGWDPVTPPFPFVSPGFHVGYPEIYAEVAGLSLTNASCPGETSGSFLDRELPDNGCGDVRDIFGLKVDHGAGSQLGYAVDFLAANPDTQLVSIQLGANDLFRCQDAEPGCPPEERATVLGTLGANLSTALGALRTVYDGRIIVVSYYAIDYRAEDDLSLAEATDAVFTEVITGFENVYLADGLGAFAPAAARAGGDTCAAGLLLRERDGTCDVHPADRGHRLLAQALAEGRTGSYLVCPAPPGASIDADIPRDVLGVHRDAMTCALEYGMVRGFADGTFRPRATITRGQAATFLRSYIETGLGAELQVPNRPPFDDIADSTHASDIAALQYAGLVAGRADGSFGPAERLSRGQFARLLLGALDLLDDPTVPGSLALPDDVVVFDDVVGTTFESDIHALAGAGIIKGVDERTFGQGEVTRGQAASLLMRAANRAAADGRWAPVTPR